MIDVKNLSGGQIDELLNSFLCLAVRPLALCSSFLRRLSVTLMAQPFSDHRRKISAIDRDEASALLLRVASETDPEIQLELFFKAHIERNLIHESLLELVRESKNYRRCEAECASGFWHDYRLDAINYRLGGKHLGQALRECEFWVNIYEKLRNEIVLLYTDKAKSTTWSIIRNTPLSIDENDMFKNMMMGVMRAIDKYFSHKGTLDGCVAMWLRNAHTNPPFPHEYGNSFSVSAGERRRITTTINDGKFAVSNLSLNIDDYHSVTDENTIENSYEENDKGVKLSHAIASVKNATVVFLIDGLPYFLSERQKKLLEATLDFSTHQSLALNATLSEEERTRRRANKVNNNTHQISGDVKNGQRMGQNPRTKVKQSSAKICRSVRTVQISQGRAECRSTLHWPRGLRMPALVNAAYQRRQRN